MTNRGTAYILYDDVADAEAAISHMHEAQLDGAVLKVSIVLPRRTFSRSPPPALRAGYGREALNSGRQPSGSFRTSPPRRGSPRRHGTGRAMDRHDLYRPRSLSRSRSPRRSRSLSLRSISASPPPRRRNSPRRDSPRRRQRRSPSYSSYSSVNSYSSYSERSETGSRSRPYRADTRRR
jgi:RNA-binding protein with serine-rich domain 1